MHILYSLTNHYFIIYVLNCFEYINSSTKSRFAFYIHFFEIVEGSFNITFSQIIKFIHITKGEKMDMFSILA